MGRRGDGLVGSAIVGSDRFNIDPGAGADELQAHAGLPQYNSRLFSPTADDHKRPACSSGEDDLYLSNAAG